MNLLQIRTNARRLVAEVSATASYSTDPDFNAYINEGVKDVCLKGKVYERTKSATIVNGVAAYSLPLDYIGKGGMRAITDPTGVGLGMMEPNGLGRVWIVTGKPTLYYISTTPLTITTRQNDTYYTLGTILIPSVANGYMYEVVVAGMSASAPPIFPVTDGATVVDNNATLLCRDYASTGYDVNLVTTPTTAGGGTGTYTITYYALDFGLWTDTAAPNFPLEYHNSLVLFACFRHFTKMKDAQRAIGFYTDYATSIGLQPPATPQEVTQ